MKKLFILALAACLFSGCGNRFALQDPLKYKGCVIVDKDEPWLHLKLTPKMRDSLHKDYLWIVTTKEDAKYFNIGDTIK